MATSPLPAAIRFAQALRDDLADTGNDLQLIRHANLPGKPDTVLVAERRMPVTLDGVPTLVLDGTADERLAPLVWGPIRRFQRVAVDHDARATMLIRSGTRTSLAGAKRETERATVSRMIQQRAAGRQMLVVGSKPVVADLDLPPDASTIYYGGADRGVDRYGAVPFIASVGWDMPSLAVAELRASALLFGTGRRIERVDAPVKVTRYQRTRSGLKPVNVLIHPNPLVQAVIEQTREAAVVQALHRVRPVMNADVELLYIGSLVLDIVVDDVIGAHTPSRADRLIQRLAAMAVIPLSEKHRPAAGLGHNLKLDEALLRQAHPRGRWIEYREAGQPGQARAGRAQRAWCSGGLDDAGAVEALRAMGVAVARIEPATAAVAAAPSPSLAADHQHMQHPTPAQHHEGEQQMDNDMTDVRAEQPAPTPSPAPAPASASAQTKQWDAAGEQVPPDIHKWELICPWDSGYPSGLEQLMVAAGELRYFDGAYYQPRRIPLSIPMANRDFIEGRPHERA